MTRSLPYPSFLGRAARFWLDLVLPESCALCGAFSSPGTRDYPLCAACEEGLRSRAETTKTRCVRCARPLAGEGGICPSCEESANAFERLCAVFDYSGKEASLVRAYKLAGYRELSRFLYSVARPWMEPFRAGWSVVPVPCSKRSMREKGWDHVELLARHAERDGFDVRRCLARSESDSQKSLDKEARGLNAIIAYGLRAQTRSVPARCLLLDDVTTTGATLKRCSSLLKGAGAETVECLVLAVDL